MIRSLIYLMVLGGLHATLLIPAARAAVVSEEQFANATIEMEQGKPEDGQHIQSLLTCLTNWHLPNAAADTKTSVERSGSAAFTVKTTLRGPTLFHFDVRQEQGDTIALLREIEYQRPGEMFDSVRDAIGKRAILHAVCGQPM